MAKKRPKGRPDSERRLRQSTRLARVLRVLELIQGRGRWNLDNLAEELECSTRTIRRDLDALELAGVPYFVDREQDSYRIRPDYRFPAINLSNDELIGQAMATAITSADGLDVSLGAKQATRKIAATSREEARKLLADAQQLVNVLGLKLADHSRHQEIIRTVQWALLERKQVTGQYESPYERKPVKLALHPYRLCLVKQAWYVIARPTDGKQPKTYRIARFKSLRMLGTAADAPADFDLEGYFGNAWAVYRGDQTYDVEVSFTPDAAGIVAETIWHRTQKVTRHKDGSATLSFRVDGLNEIVHWVLGWSGRAKVIQPAELRHLVVEHLQRALSMNITPAGSP